MVSPASLPDDLVSDILSRLPVKSVCRFRCASRGWQGLVSDPLFVAAHRSRHTEPFVVAITASSTGRDLRLMDMAGNLVKVTKDVCGSRILSTSTTDLICVTTTQANRGRAQVIDPATGKVLLDLQPDGQCGNYLFGFGRAVPSGTYKIVCLISDRRNINIHSLGDAELWRLAPLPPPYLFHKEASPVVVNGVMYFLVSNSWDCHDCKLLCFDLETEAWKKAMEGPQKAAGPEAWNKTTQARITDLKDTLCMAQWEFCATNLWLLTDCENDSWIKMYTIPFVFPANPPCVTFRVTGDGDKLMFCCASADGKEKSIQVYDPCYRTRTVLPGLAGDAISIGLCSLHLDCFVSPPISLALGSYLS